MPNIIFRPRKSEPPFINVQDAQPLNIPVLSMHNLKQFNETTQHRKASPGLTIQYACTTASLTPRFLCCSIKDDEVMRLANTNLPTATKRTGEFNLKRDPLIQRQAFPLSFGKTLRLTVQPSDASATARRPCAR